MERYVITFGQRAVGVCNGWVEVEARNEYIVRAWARRQYGSIWSGIYPHSTWDPSTAAMFPLGKLGETTLHYQDAEHV